MEPILMMAPPPQGGEGGGGLGGMLVGLFPIILIFLIFYLLVFRPNSKRQKELSKAIEALKQGDRVLTTGGLYGTVISNKEDGGIFVLKIADQVKVEVAKSAITQVVKKARES